VQLWRCNNWANQQWWANWNNGAVTTIQTPGPPAGPAKCLTAFGNGTVWTTTCDTGDGAESELWRIQAVNDVVRIQSVVTNLCLDVAHNAGYNGAPVWQFTCHNDDLNQWWILHYNSI